jgi:hypothetical protein
MPWYEGRPLDKLLGAGDRVVALSRAEARPIFVRIAQGLSAMHAVGIHHHDIKPENIFLAEIAGFPDGLPILLDLGISTKRGENPKGLTVAYASPESAAAMLGNFQGPIGGATDVYSLALALRNALDPTLVEGDTSDDLPRLHRRATTAVALSSKRELRYLAPYFERWLSLDPDKRPTAGQFADELAVLTLPEEKRAARVRLLKRAGPLVLLAGLLIATLVSQLETQKSALDAQQHELQDERGTAEQLRNQSAAQLAEIEAQGKSLGSKSQQLEQAIAVGRRLHGQLTTAAKHNDQLDRQNVKLTAERDSLSQANARLTGERDALAADKSMLTGERDGLAQEKRILSGERDALLQDKRALTAERDTLAQEKSALGAARDALLEERRALTAERDQLSQDRRVLSDENERLKRQLEELRNAAPAPAPPAPAEVPPAP